MSTQNAIRSVSCFHSSMYSSTESRHCWLNSATP